MVRGTVFAHKAGTVETHHHLQFLQRHIVDNLVVGPLHKRGIDVAERHHALRGKSRGEGDGVLLGDTHVETTVGHGLHHNIQRATRWHCGSYAHYLGIFPCKFEDGISKHLLITQRLVFFVGFLLFAGVHVVFAGSVVGDGVLHGHLHAPTLLGDDVQQFRAFDGAQTGEDFYQIGQVVAVDGTEIAEAEGFEHIALLEERGFEVEQYVAEKATYALAEGVVARPVPDLGFHTVVRPRRGNFCQVMAQRTHALVDGDAVVVEYHQHVGTRLACVVEGFESHAACHRAVADNSYVVAAVVALQMRRHRHSQRRRNGGGGMSRAEGVELALLHFRETADAAVGAYGVELAFAACEYLVRIGLMAHVPHQLVVGSVEHIMQSHSKFHHPESRSQMPGMGGEDLHYIASQVGTELLQLLRRQLFKVVGCVYFV